MTVKIEEKIQIKHFIGTLQTPELRAALEKSRWNPEGDRDLMQLRYEDKLYVGLFARKAQLTLKELAIAEQWVRKKIRFYCPDFPDAKAKVLIFSQTFIS